MKCIAVESKNYNNFFELSKLEDCLTVVMIVNRYLNIDITLKEAEDLWHSVSESLYCAWWLFLPPRDEDIFATIFEYLEQIVKHHLNKNVFSEGDSVGKLLIWELPYLDEKFVVREY